MFVAVTTRNRPWCLGPCLEHLSRFARGAEVVVHDDASDDPGENARLCRLHGARHALHAERGGVAATKNHCLRDFVSSGSGHCFLLDDDCWPVIAGGLELYAETAEATGVEHMMLSAQAGRRHRVVRELAGGAVQCYSACTGMLLYATRRAVEAVGAMDEEFGLFGNEHVRWSCRMKDAGMTCGELVCVPRHASQFWRSLDLEVARGQTPEFGGHTFASSVEGEDRGRYEADALVMWQKVRDYPTYRPL